MSVSPSISSTDFIKLAQKLTGELHWDEAMRVIYATDASVYRKLPLAVCLPETVQDIQNLVAFARERSCPLIPRAAGTSLAGQVVGEGMVVDISKRWNRILELNVNERWARVQPGVVRDELNQFLKPHGLMFAPETSTSTRCMIGGMAGNNSCGTHSLVYGSTRDHVLEIEAVLSDGSLARFGPLNAEQLEEKRALANLEGQVYRKIHHMVSDADNRSAFLDNFPHPRIHRRNTGYALDLVAPCATLERPFSLVPLLCGSEGTLAHFTELKLKLVPTPPAEQAVVAAHLDSIPQAARATLVARRFQPRAIELIDRVIIECARTNPEQTANSAFIQGTPGALLVVEFAEATREQVDLRIQNLLAALRSAGLGSHAPIIRNKEIDAVWSLRNAGLGVLTNVPSDRKPIAGIEDTAVLPEDLPEYVDAFLEIMSKRGVDSVAYAHIGDGEIHFRPMLDLKLGTDRKLYREIAEDVADLVKRFQGSLSGEHGDGRARAEFIRKMIGERCYQLCRDVKAAFDPNGIFNPGKIVDAPPIDTELRYEADQRTRDFDTIFDFSATQGILRMAEKCNGTAACRKTERIGGVMCPSYMATRNEKDTTRSRANALREYLTRSQRANPFDHEEIMEVMKLCLSCKGCKSECPSNVDVARLKAEATYQYHRLNGIPFADRAIGNVASLYSAASYTPRLANAMMRVPFLLECGKRALGIARKRSIPTFSPLSLRRWIKRNLPSINPPVGSAVRRVALFIDEYTNATDAHIGIAAIELLTSLGYRVECPDHAESGRAFLSKGMLERARKVADKNVESLYPFINNDLPLIGIEPSAILGFRDEYPDLVSSELRTKARELANHAVLIDEFLSDEILAERIRPESFTEEKRQIVFHGHCHQKALSSQESSKRLLELPRNYSARILPTGCCGMAGSFGYDRDTYSVSQQIAELALFPELRQTTATTIVSANGTSCRHQISDGLKRAARHPVEVLRDALR
ncbi:FAD-linked oxidase C-terminal domain-containing protein [Pelagicoccus sp. SDUM812003]|uniref:FAD-binding and (Fe-S)-binding domain-containing protein n=1 Tax=Pelagicoccus sp. SDUM812003 TaxID=3041267 RepID=UPI00280F8ADA|nr:FAD-linked oxidase C-terminal domain-containing protein [Pelagicoccus sp. SDUM812003]MDQ8205115.1 FAD-linked oxidase C-terminal domain-containing protein [Pelagicoccus sp. SDUM812003]